MHSQELPKDPLERLRHWRNRPQRDQSLAFLKQQFQRQIEKPFKQLEKIAQLWQALVPADLLPHTRLESLTRGTLRVGIDSSARLYELDRLLRQSLQRELLAACPGTLRKIQLRANPGSFATDEHR
ncbi:MAG: DciA family protein [Phycisphaeraceae bacterium]